MILKVKTTARTQLIDITSDINTLLRSQPSIQQGLLMLFVPHTTAAVTINESADPSVKADMLKVLNKVIPFDDDYAHMEGNSAAHIKSTLVGASELVAVENGRLVLGTWQGVFFCEFDGPRRRNLHISLVQGQSGS